MKRIKKILVWLFLSLILVTIAACSGTTSKDDQFFSDIFTTWSDKSKAAQQAAAKTHNESEKGSAALKASFNKEWEEMQNYQQADFKDEELGATVQTYLKELKSCCDALNGQDTVANMKAFNEHYKKRRAALQTLSKDSRWVLSSKALDEYDVEASEKRLAEAEASQKKAKKYLSKFEDNLNHIEFTVLKKPAGSEQAVELQGKLTNTCGTDVANLKISFHFKDKHGREKGSDTYQTDIIKNGQTQTFKITNPDSSASQIEISIDKPMEFK